MIPKFKPGDYVKCSQFRGIAMYVHDFAIKHDYDDESDYCEHSYYENIYECVMVGDDQGHNIHEDDLEFLSTNEFCIECGQIGCGHNVLEVEE